MRWLFVAKLLCLLSFSQLIAQSPFTVQFQSGPQNFPENLQTFVDEAVPAYDLFHGKYFRYIQFYTLPNANRHALMKKMGIDLLAYIPHQTYLAALPENLNRSLLLDLDIRAVVRPSAIEKTARRINEGDLPDWAVIGNEINLNVSYVAGLEPSWVELEINKLPVRILDHPEGANSLVLRIPTDQIYALADLPMVTFVEPIDAPAEAEDTRGRSLHRANVLASEYPAGRHYDGAGINILVRDDGGIGPHIDFQGRTDQSSTGGPGGGTHGDGVAGVFAGAGNLDPTVQGAASGSFIYVINYQSSFTDNTLPLHQEDDVMITNSSYSNGCNAGYTTTTQRVDQQTYDNPSLLHVFSAGNSNNTDCGYGAGNQWGNITGGHKMGKNVIATANLYADASLVGSSSRGPAHDGRIKPDMAAHGQGQISTDPNNTYGAFGGTSAAAPSGAGVIAQLYQAYRELNSNAYPESPLIKAVVMNTAYDLGNPGPDFKYGWGQYNGLRAVETLEDDRYFNATVSHGDSNIHTINIPVGVEEARIMVYWLDKEGSPAAAKALVNDLDMQVILGGTTYLPLVLDHSPNTTSLDLPAMPSVDTLNNVEQVRLSSPAAGAYQLKVKGSEVPFGPQKYYVTYEFIEDEITVTYPLGGEGFVPGTTERLHWDAWGNSGNFTVEYSTNNGSSWTVISSSVSGNDRLLDWTVPTTVTAEALIRVSRSGLSDQSEANFNIIGLPTNISIDQVCPSYTRISWTAVTGATSYEVMALGNQYMEAKGTTSLLTFDIPNLNPFQENWVTVRALGPNNLRGRRANAVEVPIGLLGCALNNDLASNELVTPLGNSFNSCFDDTIWVSVELRNEGQVAESNIPVFYQMDGGLIVGETYTGTLSPGAIDTFYFSNGISLMGLPPGGGPFLLEVWNGLGTDQNQWNDTVSSQIEIFDEILLIGGAEDFENYDLCPTNSNCGGTICPLGNGWINASNGPVDDIDWRVDEGGTPSNNTGPNVDHNPGTPTGNYLYLEASNGCTNQEAHLLSPCLDLSGTTGPMMTFWYHMNGTAIGELHVDVFNGTSWDLDVISPLIGAQGNQWILSEVPLFNYAGMNVQVRIRGITGNDWSSDIAIDDIGLVDLGVITVDFSADKQLVCTGKEVQLIDESTQGVDTWIWNIAPTTFNYVSGTNSSSQSPIVVFNATGTYTISLIASSPFASDTTVKAAFIQVDNSGFAPPLVEDFQSTAFPPPNWTLDNPDGGITWEQLLVTGSDGNPTLAAYINNYSYFNTGERDALSSYNLDLTQVLNPTLSFDVAYVQYSNAYVDSLEIWISTDCGINFDTLVYDKFGTNLATAPDETSPWEPLSSADWRRDSVDLSFWEGSTVVVQFVNVTGYGNSLFLDNINLEGQPLAAPSADILPASNAVCENVSLMIDANTSLASTYQWDFGLDAVPATASTAGPHNVSWTSTGLKMVVLTVSNAVGSSSDTTYIQVDPLTIADFTANTSNGYDYSFTNTSTNGLSYLWDFGDGNSSMMVNPNHQYTSNGTYTIYLYSSNGCGTDTMSQTVIVNSITPPLVAFTATDSAICVGVPIVFIDATTGIGINAYQWDFGPGAFPATAFSPGPHVVTYSTPGPKNVILSVSNSTGTSTETLVISAEPLPTANFTPSSSGISSYLFANASQDATLFFWDFGDGTTSTLISPSHTYLSNGAFIVRLVAVNDCGMDTLEQTLNVSGVQPPAASFILTDTLICEGEDLILTDNSTGLGINAHQWEFGVGADPAFGTGPGPHTIHYDVPGIKQIILNVSNQVGNSADTQYVEVLPLPNAGFSSTQNGLSDFDFMDQSQNGLSYNWDFGDGNSSTAQNPSHTYLSNDTFTVRLIVTNSCGNDTVYENLVVSGITAPETQFEKTDTSICVGESITFTDASTGLGINSYAWSFGLDASPASASTQGPHTVSYQSPGQKMVILTVGNQVGTQADTQWVNVLPLPSASFNASLQTGQTWDFLNTSMDAIGYNWEFGDGNSSTQVSPSHTYTSNGSFTVLLIAENDCGFDTASFVVEIQNVSLQNDFPDLMVEIFPNPASDQFFIRLSGEGNYQLKLQMLDVRGRLVKENELIYEGITKDYPLNTTQLARGLYMIHLADQDRHLYKRIILE